MRTDLDIKVIIFFMITIVTILAIQTSNAYAVDFVDHTGYTPYWAQSMGTYQTLDKCNGIAGENSADGNWCMEWVASVIDQGSNSPNQQQNSLNQQPIHPTTNMAQRTCSINTVCVFPDEFLKYDGSYYDAYYHQYKKAFAAAYFGYLVGDNGIAVREEMTKYFPKTYVLNMSSGILSNGTATMPLRNGAVYAYNITAGGDKVFDYIRSIPVKKSLENECSPDEDCKITFDKKTINGITRTILTERFNNYYGNGTFSESDYDNDTGVILGMILTKMADNKTVVDELHLVDSNVYDHPTIIVSPNVQPTTNILSANQNSTILNEQPNAVLTQNETSKSNPIESNVTTTSSNSNDMTIYDKIGAITVFIVIPIIIIVIVVYKIKKYLAKRRNNKLQKGM